jgi:hypothetical protein
MLKTFRILPPSNLGLIFASVVSLDFGVRAVTLPCPDGSPVATARREHLGMIRSPPILRLPAMVVLSCSWPVRARVSGASSSQHPVANVALAIEAGSRGDHATVGPKPYRVCHAGSDLDDVRPAADTALTIVVPSRGDHSTIGL